ncbi:MAG: sensor histidine kinase [Rickettsiaceae bacterium]
MIQTKHIIRLSFLGLFINIIVIVMLYQYFIIEEVILKHFADKHIALSNKYQNNLLSDDNKIDIELNSKDLINFLSSSIKFFDNANVRMSIFDNSGNRFLTNAKFDIYDLDFQRYHKDYTYTIYQQTMSLIDKIFLRESIYNNNISKAFNGNAQHVIFPDSLTSLDFESRTFITSYIPITQTINGVKFVKWIITIDSDITTQWNKIHKLDNVGVIIFIMIFIVFFSIVIYHTRHAQKVINKQSVTNQELAQAKMLVEKQNLAQTEFLSNISHELRTPLNAIIGFSEIILSKTKLNIDKYKEYVQDINNSGRHLLSVINDILDFSKVSANKLRVESVEVDLNKVIASSIRFLTPKANKVGIKLIYKAYEEQITILADQKRLKQSLLNLLSNSVKFTEANGKVEVQVVKDILTKNVYIKIIDTGIGIKKQDIPKALSVFDQIDNKLNREYQGTGLGLPLTKKLIELMSGTFKIESEVNIGTTVTITFKYINAGKF